MLGRAALDRRGGVALAAAVLVPIFAVLVAGAVELEVMYKDRLHTQDVADTAALFGAQQLGVAPDGAAERTKAFALAQLEALAQRSDVAVSAVLADKSTLKVAVDTHRASFFGNLLPPGGMRTHSEASAVGEGMVPLCVLVFGSTDHDDLNVKASARLHAPSCLVHSNQDFTVDSGATVEASVNETVAKAAGTANPAVSVGAAPLDDPFKNVSIGSAKCTGPKPSAQTMTGLLTLSPQTFCSDLNLKGALVQLQPGEYYFKGKLDVDDLSQLKGTDVVLIFEKGAHFTFGTGSGIDLAGRETGALAGFVIVANRSNTDDFTILSDHVTRLVGTVYTPAAKLHVTGKSAVAQSSAWTVIAAKALLLDGSPYLVLNTAYAASDVPVPVGVGHKIQRARLLH